MKNYENLSYKKLTLDLDKMRSSLMIVSILHKEDPVIHNMQSIVPSSHD